MSGLPPPPDSVSGRKRLKAVRGIVVAIVVIVVLLFLAFVPVISSERDYRYEVFVEGMQPEPYTESVCVQWFLLWCQEWKYVDTQRMNGYIRIRNNEDINGEFLLTVRIYQNGTLYDEDVRTIMVYAKNIAESSYSYHWLNATPTRYEMRYEVSPPKIAETVSVFGWVWKQFSP